MQVVALAGEAGVLLLLYDEDQVRGCSADVKDKVRGSCVIASVKKVGETSADNFWDKKVQNDRTTCRTPSDQKSFY